MRHEIEIRSVGLSTEWAAECVCGWVGEDRGLWTHASADGERHIEEVMWTPQMAAEMYERLAGKNVMTPNPLRYGWAGRFVYEIAEGEDFDGDTVFGVSVRELCPECLGQAIQHLFDSDHICEHPCLHCEGKGTTLTDRALEASLLFKTRDRADAYVDALAADDGVI